MDQATELRHFVANHHGQRCAVAARLRMVVVAGGKGGVGTTSVAICLAQSLQQLGALVALVDADLGRADATKRLGVAARHGMIDILDGQCELDDIAADTPCGLWLVPGAWSQAADVTQMPRAKRHLLDSLQSLDRTSDWTIVDAGNTPSHLVAAMCLATDSLLLVTTADDMAVIDTYAALKTFGIERSECDRAPQIGLLVNRAPDRSQAAEVHGRIAQAAYRFLGLHVEFAGHLPPGMAPVAVGDDKLASTCSNRDAVIFGLARSLINKTENFHSTATPTQPI